MDALHQFVTHVYTFYEVDMAKRDGVFSYKVDVSDMIIFLFLECF